MMTTVYDDLGLWHVRVVCTKEHDRPHTVRQFVKDPQRETLWRAMNVETAESRRNAERYYAWRDAGSEAGEFLEAKQRGEAWVNGPGASNATMDPVSVTEAGTLVPTTPDDVPPVAISGGLSHMTAPEGAGSDVRRKHVLTCDRCSRRRASSVEVNEELLSRALDAFHRDGRLAVTPEEVSRRVNEVKEG